MGILYVFNVYIFYFKFCMEIWKDNVKKIILYGWKYDRNMML